MAILSKYIVREYARVFCLSLGALILIYLVSEFFSKIGKFSQHHAAATAILSYFGLRIPRALYEMLPLAALMASLLSMSAFSRHSEITAMRACGVGLFRIASPVVVFAFGLGLAAFAANWSWIPFSTAQAHTIKTSTIEQGAAAATPQRARIWMRLERRTFLNVRMADPVQQALYGVRWYQLRDDFSLAEEIDAPEVRYRNHAWIASSGLHRLFGTDGSMHVERFSERPLEIAKTPDEFLPVEIKEEHLAYPQLRDYVAELSRSGIDPGRYAVDLAARSALPFVCVVMALLGIPFGIRETRRGGWGMAVGVSLALALAYWIVYSVAISLGRGGVLPPWIAAWAANGIFLVLGLALLVQKRQ